MTVMTVDSMIQELQRLHDNGLGSMTVSAFSSGWAPAKIHLNYSIDDTDPLDPKVRISRIAVLPE